ncbi:MAG: sugar nucleotide-binding protein, partial [Crocinitomicaceae bacterium]
MKVLITGSNGLLGQKLVALLSKNRISFTAASLGENRNPECPKEHYVSLDITNSRAVDETLTRHEFTHILHTAAMTHVDACEMNPEECYAIN